MKDDYTLPAAHYEMAVLGWAESNDKDCWPNGNGFDSEKSGVEDAAQVYRLKKVAEAQVWLDKVAKWETFVLDTRFGMRIQTGLEVFKWFKNKFGAA